MSNNSISPIISDELDHYLRDVLGEKLANKYFSSINQPMEKYTLHIFRNYNIADSILDKLATKGYKASINTKFDNLINIIPQGPFNLTNLEGLSSIVVDKIASEMIYQGADLYIPGIKKLQKIKRNELIKIISPFNITVAKAKTKLNSVEISSKKKGLAAKNFLSPYKVPSIYELKLSKKPAYFQSFPSYLTSIILNPEESDRILECCAAPGNKTIHLSELTQNKAKIIAIDRSQKRMNNLINKVNQFKLKNIHPIVDDIIKLSKNWKVKFDKILVDPPCTSLGVRPRLHLIETKKNIIQTAKYQKAILYACDKLLKRNGQLVYSTCTITNEENEAIIDYAISKLNYTLEDPERYYDKKSMYKKKFEKTHKFIPGKDHTAGFFIAKLRKKE